MDRRNFLQTAGVTATAAAMGARYVTAARAETPKKSAVKRLPLRSEVPEADTWDLSKLFPSDEAWDKAFAAWKKQIEGYAAFQGKLAESPQTLAACLEFDLAVSRAGDRLGTYAMLRTAQDQGNSTYQRMQGRFSQLAARAGEAGSYIRPEILAIDAAKIDEFLRAPALAPYKLLLERIVRFRPHTLGAREEKLLAMQSEVSDSPQRIFHQLQDADLKFGTVVDEKGETVELSQASFMSLLYSADRDVRCRAFHTFYTQYAAHEHAFAATLNASMQGDIYNAKARNYASALEAAMFPDSVPVSVYDNLLTSIHRQLPALYHYYDLRRRKMGLKDIHHYDTYVPILAQMRTQYTWQQAVDMVIAAVKPLGSEYGDVLRRGLEGRWCDRYENRGKQSGAFSAGSYDGDPYILINYRSDVLDHVFTIAHEGGHSMHSYFSGKAQPYAYYQYSLFVAEVASTFNEQLLSHYLLSRAGDKRQRAFLLNRQIDAIRATIYRQAMFAEFEKLAHASAEAGEPLTLDRFKEIYHGLLKLYFGPDFTLDAQLDLECLRIPHFYRAFYVYKYATSLSAAMALVDRVLHGGPQELNDYLTFLHGGCSKEPLDLLRGAGVDLEKPEPIDRALAQFGQMVKELDTLI